MRILSLFDGMACGYLAMQRAGVDVEAYHAYEIDKYAVKTAQHNFPDIQEHGDVFTADFTTYRGLVDFLVGGSPCTYWSIAQTKNRETEASGLGWELFSQYVRALHESKPRYFIYENNKSMAKAIRDQIRATFGFEEICINSALVSAQNRQRYYWVGKRNEDGTYSKVDVQQPEDLGILLKDVLDGAGAKELTEREMEYMVRDTANCGNHFSFGYIQKGNEDKAKCLTSNISKGVPYNVCCEPVRVGTYPGSKCPECDSKQYRIYATDGKAVTQCGQGGGLGAKTGLYAVPVGCSIVGRRVNEDGHRDDYNENLEHFQRVEINENPQKSRCVSTVSKDSMVCEPCCMRYERTEEAKACRKAYEAHEIHHGYHEMSELHPREDGKCNTLTTVQKDNPICESVPQYATPTEWDDNGIPTKATSGADGKEYTVYPVEDGKITIKGNTYPIKLVDGYYIIRKLTVSECKRLQTVPEWYDFSCVSNSQAYKMLGNGWTVDVIAHLIKACLEDTHE